MYLTEEQRIYHKNLRRYFHQYPELSTEEKSTSDRIVKELDKLDIPCITGIGGYGVLATIDSGNDGPALLFRADIDALPIVEVNDFSYRSVKVGVSHKCGHDGHLTTLLLFASLLTENKPTSGSISLLFQPAEETGEGALSVLDDDSFKNNHFDHVFAYHNLPGFELGQIVCKNGPFTASVKSAVIKLKGKSSHAAEPENGASPALLISRLIDEFDKLSNNSLDDLALITIVHAKLGEQAYGITPGEAEIHLTFRTWTQKRMDQLTNDIEKITNHLASKHNIDYTINYCHVFEANENEISCFKSVQLAAEKNGYPFAVPQYPFKWGEDFGLFTQRFQGAMFGIGAGLNCPALHNPDYDFPDELLEVGASMFLELSRQYCYE